MLGVGGGAVVWVGVGRVWVEAGGGGRVWGGCGLMLGMFMGGEKILQLAM